MNGKLNGRLFVGTTPVELSNNDLHSYVVVNDGRAYVAISNIPKSVGPSLQPLSSLGGVIGWAFALEQRGYKNGFSLIGRNQWTRFSASKTNPYLVHAYIIVALVVIYQLHTSYHTSLPPGKMHVFVLVYPLH